LRGQGLIRLALVFGRSSSLGFRCGSHEVRERDMLRRAWGSRKRRDRDGRSVEGAGIAISRFHQLRDTVLERTGRTAKSESCEVSLVHDPLVPSTSWHQTRSMTHRFSWSGSAAERSDRGDDQENGSDQGHSPKGFGPQILLVA
jgi:hypothetical protein